jgi:hypothetical protein
VSVHTTSVHNLISQLPVVAQLAFTTILYLEDAVNVNVCVNVFTPVVCVAQLALVAHQAHTVQSVSLVSQGLETKLVPHKSVIVVILSILSAVIPNNCHQNIAQFTYVPVGLL